MELVYDIHDEFCNNLQREVTQNSVDNKSWKRNRPVLDPTQLFCHTCDQLEVTRPATQLDGMARDVSDVRNL